MGSEIIVFVQMKKGGDGSCKFERNRFNKKSTFKFNDETIALLYF